MRGHKRATHHLADDSARNDIELMTGNSRSSALAATIKGETHHSSTRSRTAQPAAEEGPRISEEIRVREVQLLARMAPTTASRKLTPPSPWPRKRASIWWKWRRTTYTIYRIFDYGKYKYQAQKKAAEAARNRRIVEIKEIKLRPDAIDDHDYEVKMRSIARFFEEGDKVKVTLRFRGREMAHQEIGYSLLDRVKDGTGSKSPKVESEPRFEGRGMV